MLVRIAHHPGDARQGRQLFGRPLRVAARHQNAAIWIHPLQTSYRCPRIFIRAFSDRTRVKHDNFGIARRSGALHTTFQELAFQRRSVRLRGAAAKIFYVEASHAPILNEWTLRPKLPAVAASGS